jgi:hypothetical protein
VEYTDGLWLETLTYPDGRVIYRQYGAAAVLAKLDVHWDLLADAATGP